MSKIEDIKYLMTKGILQLTESEDYPNMYEFKMEYKNLFTEEQLRDRNYLIFRLDEMQQELNKNIHMMQHALAELAEQSEKPSMTEKERSDGGEQNPSNKGGMGR